MCSATSNEVVLVRLIRFALVTVHACAGTVPSTISGASSLSLVDLAFNALGGDLSAWMPSNAFPYLENLIISFNQFHGNLPQSLSSLSRLLWLELEHNKLMGSFPSMMQLPIGLRFLNISSNSFTGMLPTETLPSLQVMDFSDNSFGGSLPSALCGSQDLYEIYAGDNRLGGTIPHCVSQLVQLYVFDVSNNCLSGTIPSSFASLTMLRVLDMHNNRLTGSLDSVFSSSASLFVVNLAQNGITGTIPEALLSLPLMETLVLSQNCFHGTISDALCSSSATLSLIDFDGLASGSRCLKPSMGDQLAMFAYSSSRFRHDEVTNTLPSCILQLSSLTMLYMSGNALAGPIPEAPPQTRLTALSLSYNRLTGKIPLSIQQLSQLTYLDLSNNHLSGTCEDMTSYALVPSSVSADSDAMELYLSSNRLSGALPSSFASAETIDVLAGNMFSCRTRSQLPQNDEAFKQYICGSNALDVAGYICICLMFVCVVLAFLVVKQLQSALRLATHTSSSSSNVHHSTPATFVFVAVKLLLDFGAAVFDSEQPQEVCGSASTSMPSSSSSFTASFPPRLLRLKQLFAHFRRIALLLTVLSIVVLLPAYCILHLSGSSSHTHTYGWLVSLAYLTGITAAIVVLVLWFITMCVTIVPVVKAPGGDDVDDEMGSSVSSCSSAVNASSSFSNVIAGWSNRWKVVTLCCCNCILMLVVNGVYVFVTLTQNASLIWVTITLLSVFKIIWNMNILPTLLGQSTSLALLSFMLAFNNAMAPCLAVALTDPSCYRSLIVPDRPIDTSYSYATCSRFNVTSGSCQLQIYTRTPFVSDASQYDPPFIYSYQCTSAIVSKYVPLFIVMYSVTGLVVPLLQYIARKKLWSRYGDISFTTPPLSHQSHDEHDAEVQSKRIANCIRAV